MGLISAGLLSGLGTGLGGAAQEMARRDREEELLREKLLDRERDRQSREAIARENNEMRAFIAGARGSSGGGGASTGAMQDFSENSPGEALRAKALGMSVPEYRQFEESNRTGNVDAFKRDVTRTTPPTVTEGPTDPNDSGMDRRLKSTTKEGTSTTTKELPKGFDEWIREKRKEAAQAEIILRSSGDADNKMKAIGNASRNRLIGDVVDAPTQEEARKAGERIGLTDGKGQFDNDGYRMINKATGENTETHEGKARAEKDQALAAKAGREPVARGGGGGGSGADAVKVHSVKTAEDGSMVAIMRDGSEKPLKVKSVDFNKTVAGLVMKMGKEDFKFAQLPIAEQRAKAVELLAVPAAAPSTRAPAAPAPGARPLDSFLTGKR